MEPNVSIIVIVAVVLIVILAGPACLGRTSIQADV
jgi:hypothetical protein